MSLALVIHNPASGPGRSHGFLVWKKKKGGIVINEPLQALNVPTEITTILLAPTKVKKSRYEYADLPNLIRVLKKLVIEFLRHAMRNKAYV